MAEFDESKVINALHKDKAEAGKMYWFADFIGILKESVESNDDSAQLTYIDGDDNCCFYIDDCLYALLYPYEAPPKQRMTNRQYAEWLAKGNGESTTSRLHCAYTCYEYEKGKDEMFVPDDYVIRPWDSDEWIEPTLDIYLRDCKHLSQDRSSEFDNVADRDGC